jgi:succinoglycan biosynthesis protein ExoU
MVAPGLLTTDKRHMGAEQQTAIVIAAFNAEATLDRALRSALEQPETAEVCVVDDGSSDGTAALARAWANRDPRVLFRAMPANAGPAAARNLAIAETRAPWIAVLDADDYLLEGRMSLLHRRAAEADFVADALLRVTEGQAPGSAADRFEPRPLGFAEFVSGNLGAARGPLDLGFLKPMFRRAFIDAHGLRYNEDMRLGEDYEFYARALALGARFLVGGAAGYVSVERASSLSKDHSETDLRRLRDCDGPLGRLRPLSPTELRALRRHWNSVDCRLQWRRLISAVKARDPAAALSTFHSPQTAAFLTARLAEQAWLRGAAALKRAPGGGSARAGA